MKNLWRKMFPVRERTVVVQAPAPVVFVQFNSDLIFVTRDGEMKALRYDHIQEQYVIRSLGTVNAR